VNRAIKSAVLFSALLSFSAAAQDWYHDRDERYRGDQWRPQIFMQVRTDLDHIYSAFNANDKERRRLDRTKEELTAMQAELDGGKWDNGHLNDVIDSIRKSSNDQRLSPRDRDVLRDDLARLKNYQDNHNHWLR
jgi:hypothetical protein